MSGCPFHTQFLPPAAAVHPPPAPPGELDFLGEIHAGPVLSGRHAACAAALARGAPAPLTAEELAWAGRIAWRNQARCIGRLHWRRLHVRDHRHLESADELAGSLREHLALAQEDGQSRPVLTVFAPSDHSGFRLPRIWNSQLCGYAGYRAADGSILGDPRNVSLTERARALGWKPPSSPGPFDLLPWIIAGRDGQPRLVPLPAGLVREVPLRHPDHPWFERLGLRWYAVPIVSNFCFRAAGTDFTAAPFNGWYMGTEIGARNLADRARYNVLPLIAEKLGLDRRSPRTLWIDRALVELNLAVLHSYAADGVRLVDHHSASSEFMRFLAAEAAAGRPVSADWSWIVPPLSPATTEVFHTPLRAFPTSPDFRPMAPDLPPSRDDAVPDLPQSVCPFGAAVPALARGPRLPPPVPARPVPSRCGHLSLATTKSASAAHPPPCRGE